MYASIDLEEIQLCKNIFFILFYRDNLSHAKILSCYLYLPIIYPSFVASAFEEKTQVKTQKILLQF